MKRTILLSTALLLSVASLSAAEDGRACSPQRLAGGWGYTITGTILPGGGSPILFAAVGKLNFDASGKAWGTQTSSLDGNAAEDTTKGTMTLNPDCTGTWSVSVYDASGTTLLRTAVWAVLFVDTAKELRAIATSMVSEASGAMAPVMTLEGKRLLPASPQ